MEGLHTLFKIIWVYYPSLFMYICIFFLFLCPSLPYCYIHTHNFYLLIVYFLYFQYGRLFTYVNWAILTFFIVLVISFLIFFPVFFSFTLIFAFFLYFIFVYLFIFSFFFLFFKNLIPLPFCVFFFPQYIPGFFYFSFINTFF